MYELVVISLNSVLGNSLTSEVVHWFWRLTWHVCTCCDQLIFDIVFGYLSIWEVDVPNECVVWSADFQQCPWLFVDFGSRCMSVLWSANFSTMSFAIFKLEISQETPSPNWKHAWFGTICWCARIVALCFLHRSVRCPRGFKLKLAHMPLQVSKMEVSPKMSFLFVASRPIPNIAQ